MHYGYYKYFLLFFLYFPLTGFSQAFHLQVELKQAARKEIFLASHYLENIYVKDTIQLDEMGRGIFIADSLLPQGLYKIFANENNHFDFLLGSDQQFSIKNNTFQSESMEIAGSDETEAFAGYTKFLKDLQKKNSEIQIGRASCWERV